MGWPPVPAGASIHAPCHAPFPCRLGSTHAECWLGIACHQNVFQAGAVHPTAADGASPGMPPHPRADVAAGTDIWVLGSEHVPRCWIPIHKCSCRNTSEATPLAILPIQPRVWRAPAEARFELMSEKETTIPGSNRGSKSTCMGCGAKPVPREPYREQQDNSSSARGQEIITGLGKRGSCLDEEGSFLGGMCKNS
jgi:hypothetical protein